MQTRLRLLALVVLCIVGTASARAAVEPTRESLLEVWEQSQRADPQTTVFERIGDGRYRFATQRFPFDGVVRVLNVVLDDRHVEIANGMTVGMVETKLEDLTDDFLRDHAFSIGLWQAGNTFYFDGDSGRWLDAGEWQRQIMDRYPTGGAWSWLSGNLFWIVFLGIVVVTLWWATRRAGRQMKTAMAAQDRALAEQERAIRMSEEMLEVARDSNRLLRRILERLDGGN